MGFIRKTITLTDLHDRSLKAQIDAGHYSNDSERSAEMERKTPSHSIYMSEKSQLNIHNY